MKLGIYIPSRGRAGAVRTLDSVPAERLADTYIVTTYGQGKDYKKAYGRDSVLPNILQAPATVTNIGQKRDWMIRHAIKQKYTHIVMLDDDLIFAKRRKDDPTKLLPQTAKDNEAMFKAIEKQFKTHEHVGITARDGANRHTEPVMYATRMMRVLGYNLDLFKGANLSFARIPLMEDFDVTLTLLRWGHPNAVLTNFTNDQGSSNAPGGCSTYRTAELQEQAANMLAAHHPNFVKVVNKPEKGGWGGERVDVQIAWKKALASSAQGDLPWE